MSNRSSRLWQYAFLGAGIAVAGPVLYALSAGPAGAVARWCYRNGYGDWDTWLWLASLYDPLGWIMRDGPGWLSGALNAYLSWWP